MAKKKSDNGATAAPQIPADEFVKAWQACADLSEAKMKLGDGAGSRAARYRKAGVKLKVMPGGGRKIDVKALNALINA